MNHDQQLRTEATLMLLRASVRERNEWITGDERVGEQTAAGLIGWSSDYLAMRRREGNGPLAYGVGGGGHKVTYRLSDIAEWIEGQREN